MFSPEMEHMKMRTFMSTIKRATALGVLAMLPLGLYACGQDVDQKKALEQLDEKLVGKASDPEMNVAVQDRIIIDPALADSANINNVKAAPEPLDGAIPANTASESGGAARSLMMAPASGAPVALASAEIESKNLLRAPKPTVIKASQCKSCGAERAKTLGALADDEGVKRGNGTCNANMSYGANWANRLPADFPVYPRSRVLEAAGVEAASCNIRAVTFTTAASMQDVVDYYYTRANRGGFSAEYQLRSGEHVLGGTRDRDDGAYFITFNPAAGGGTSVDIVANNGR
jgi:hypothetical protein